MLMCPRAKCVLHQGDPQTDVTTKSRDSRITQSGLRRVDPNMFYLISANRKRSLCVARKSMVLTVFSVVFRMEATVCSLRPS